MTTPKQHVCKVILVISLSLSQAEQEMESLEQDMDYFSYLQASDLLLQNISHLFQEAQN